MNSNYKIKLVSLILVLVMAVVSLTSCGTPNEAENNGDEGNKITLATPSIGIGRHQQEVDKPTNDPAEDTGIVICIEPSRVITANTISTRKEMVLPHAQRRITAKPPQRMPP